MREEIRVLHLAVAHEPQRGKTKRPRLGESRDAFWKHSVLSSDVVGRQSHSMRIVLPIMLGLPAMVSSVPPLMIFIPAILPFGIQISPPSIRLAAVLSPVMDRSVQSCFRFFDGMLTPGPVIGVDKRRRHKYQKRACHNGCHYVLSKSSIQDFLLSVFDGCNPELAGLYRSPAPSSRYSAYGIY